MSQEDKYKAAWLNLKHMMHNTHVELEKARIVNDASIPNVSTQIAMVNKIAYTMEQLEYLLRIQNEAPDRLIIQ